MSIVILLIGIAAIALGYGLYARTINRDVIQPDDNRTTPAKMYMDGVDFAPANRNVLFGYQFKSIAALGPITGPIIAVKWGWLPALIWIVVGTFFIGWVQDYASIVVTMREEGQTFGGLSYRLISPRSRNILLLFIYFYLLLIMGAFGNLVGFSLMTNPSIPLGVILVILFGVLAGQMTYKWKQDIVLTTIVTVILAFLGIWFGAGLPIGDQNLIQAIPDFFARLYGTFGGATSPIWFLSVTQAMFLGSMLVVIICYLGAVLPIWRWAQPINYVAFWIVLVGIIGGVIGLLIWHPGMGDFPAFTEWNVPGLGWLWPILFVTIACGAISGWHSLVSSSGTARQIEKESDALFVGGGSMFLEMFFAIMAFLTATVAFGSFQGYIDAGSPLQVFSVGLATFMNQWGLPMTLGVPYGGVFLVLMALTIMYLVVRFMRVASAEALGDSIPVMRNVHVGSVIALLLTLFLIWIVPFLGIWVMFGAANQLMASLALLLITLWLMSKGKSYMWTFVPFVFMFVTTIAALLYKVVESIDKLAAPGLTGEAIAANVIIALVAILLVVAAGILAWDGLQAIRRFRAQAAPAPTGGGE
ncbi:MAG: carbon starvation protein A [Anaerolineae bacterium]|nr:carbon starvation protein A [Anaerolineae bacterium]